MMHPIRGWSSSMDVIASSTDICPIHGWAHYFAGAFHPSRRGWVHQPEKNPWIAVEIPRLEITDVESATNNHLYFPLFPIVPLRCLLLDSPSSSLSLTRRPFCKRRWGISRLGHSTWSLSPPPWQATPHLTSAFTQAHLRVEHKLRLSLHLQKTGTLSVVLSRAATACKVIFQSGAGVVISRSIVDGRGINSDVGKFRSSMPYFVWIS